MIRRRDILLLGAGCFAGTGLLTRGAVPQVKYPERLIRLLIPSSQGGTTDAIGRRWADKMKEPLGPVFVENIGGGGGSIGAAVISRADADGYSILSGGAGVLILIPIASHPPYDRERDFAPISILGAVPLPRLRGVPSRKRLIDGGP